MTFCLTSRPALAACCRLLTTNKQLQQVDLQCPNHYLLSPGRTGPVNASDRDSPNSSVDVS